VSAYASIPRSYDLSYLRDVRLAKQLFPAAEPVPALAFPKPGQTIRLVPSLRALRAPAFPKPAQSIRWTLGGVDGETNGTEVSSGPDRDDDKHQKAATISNPCDGLEQRVVLCVESQELCCGEHDSGTHAGRNRDLGTGIGCLNSYEQFLFALIELAGNDLALEAIQFDIAAVGRHFGMRPDAALFARCYEQYLADGNAPEELQRVFRDYGWWLNLKRGEA
jgi:hypothetical protein